MNQLRITLITPNYFPETNAGAKRITRIAEHLASSGWAVNVITLLPHHPQNRVFTGFEKQGGVTRTEEGVSVTRLRPWIVPKGNLAVRLIAESVACIRMAAFELKRKERSDIYLASSPFMFLGPTGLLVSLLRGRPFIWDVRDLTWLYPRAAGKRTFGFDRLLERWMRSVARSSSALITATQGLFDYFEQRPSLGGPLPNGVSAEVLVSLDPGWSPENDEIEPRAAPRVVYAGLFGYNHDLMTVVEAARLLPRVDFLFVGDGPDRELLKNAAEGSNNVEFLPYLPFEALTGIYRSATVLVSHVRKNPIFKWTQPAKLWEYMASGKPVVHAGEGEVIRILQSNSIAVTVPPQDARALAEAIESVLQDPVAAAAMGARGREYVAANRNSEVILKELESLLKQVLATRAPP